PKFIDRAEILWEKGTDRAAFFRGDIDAYGWVDVGSSFLPSELIAAVLWAQLEKLESIQQQRVEKWNYYADRLQFLKDDFGIQLPKIPYYATHNGHLFYLVCSSGKQRSALIDHLNLQGILAVFHYQSLHRSKYYTSHSEKIPHLPNADEYSRCLLRLPLYFELTEKEQDTIEQSPREFFEKG